MSNYIRAYSIFIIGIACLIILAFIFRLGRNVIQCSLQNIYLVVNTITVFIYCTVNLLNGTIISVWQSF